MRTQRVFISDGMDAVTDLSMIGDQRSAAFVSNMDLRGMMAKPVRGPRILRRSTDMIPVQYFRYRGKEILSERRRSYIAHMYDGRERIYWTEERGEAKKMIEGIELPLGVNRPIYAPGVVKGSALAPSGIKIVVEAGGSLTKDSLVSFRLAYRTRSGILPASGSVSAKIDAAASKVRLTWTNPVMDEQPSEIVVFYGSMEGQERMVGTIGAGSTEYLFSGVISGMEPATVYDQEETFQYAYTFVQNVAGIETESGPSAPSVRVKSSSGRKIQFNPWLEGLRDSSSLRKLEHYGLRFQFVKLSGLTGSDEANAVGVVSISEDAETGQCVMVVSESYAFVDGEMVIVAGLTPDPFGGMPVELRPVAGNPVAYELLVPTGFAYPGTGLVGVTAFRRTSSPIASVIYNHNTGLIEIKTTTAHTLRSGRKAIFKGFSDPSWNGREYEVLTDFADPKKLFVEGVKAPSDTVFSTQTVELAACGLYVHGLYGDIIPSAGDIAYIETDDYTGTPNALGRIGDSLIVDAQIPNQLDNPVLSPAAGYATGLSWVPKNDYIVLRRLYRVGGTGLFRHVADVELSRSEYLDVLPDEALGNPMTSWYKARGIDVIFEPPPFGLVGLRSHYDMGFAWDPASNRLYFTPKGQYDAWPSNFFFKFDHRILATVPYDQALIVLCEDRPYRIDGTEPTNLVKTSARSASGCKAGGSAQVVNNRLIYLADEGLVMFDGQDTHALTEQRIPSEFWRGMSRYEPASSGPNSFLVPVQQDAAFYRLRDVSLPLGMPEAIVPYLPSSKPLYAIKSFTKNSRYFLYWSADTREAEAQTMICVDFGRKEMPITVIGLKVVDVFVDELERAWAIIYPHGNNRPENMPV